MFALDYKNVKLVVLSHWFNLRDVYLTPTRHDGNDSKKTSKVCGEVNVGTSLEPGLANETFRFLLVLPNAITDIVA